MDLEKLIRDRNNNNTLSDIQQQLLGQITSNSMGFPIINTMGVNIDEYVDVPLDHLPSPDDYVMVHTTKLFPRDLLIRTSQSAKSQVTGRRFSKMLNENQQLISYDSATFGRNTIHFAVNGLVSSHENGDFRDRDYIILDPMENHIDQIVTLRPEDTFTYGSVQLSNESIILINEEKFDRIYKENKSEIDKNRNRIILFNGDETKAVQMLLIMLGYKPRRISKNSYWPLVSERKGIIPMHVIETMRSLGFCGGIDNIDLRNYLQEEFEYMRSQFPKKDDRQHADTEYAGVEFEILDRRIALKNIRSAGRYLSESNYIDNNKTDNSKNKLDKKKKLNDTINLEELYSLYEIYCKLHEQSRLYDFVCDWGIEIHDNEIHLLETDELIERKKMLGSGDSNFKKRMKYQEGKCELLLQKYKLLKKYNEHVMPERITYIEDRRESLKENLGEDVFKNGNVGSEISFDQFFKLWCNLDDLFTSCSYIYGVYKIDYLNKKVYMCSDAYLHKCDSVDKKEELEYIEQYMNDNNITDQQLWNKLMDKKSILDGNLYY